MLSLFEQAAIVLRRADALLITAGAGMGVDSGLPDFRGPQGFWKAYPAYKQLGLSFAQLANPRWFIDDPQLAWGFYGHRLNLYRSTLPHAGFERLRRWATRMTLGAWIYTSNVDGQFQRAGFTQNQICEAHGSIHFLQCLSNCGNAIWPADSVEVLVDPLTFRARGTLPRCPKCGELARPNILMFGDDGWVAHRTDAQERALDDWLSSCKGKSLVIIECGAGSAVPTVRRYSEYTADMHPATLIRINLREPDVTTGHIGMEMGAADALKAIDAAWADHQ